MDAAYTPPPEVARYQRTALIVGVALLVLSIIGAILRPDEFFRSYLLGFVFWLGIPVGCLALLMLQHLTGGAWGLVIRRVLESATRTLPLMLLLLIPILIGMWLGHIFEWAHPEHIANEEARKIVLMKHRYLNMGFFIVRAILYFAIWLVLMFFLNKWSGEQDRTANRALSRQFRLVSGPGLVLFVLTVTFASVDWVMSLDPEWFSTIFGLVFVINWTLTSFSFVILIMVALMNRRPMNEVLQPRHFHDLGKLLLAFVMIWAYFNFSQYLIIWSGNIPEETEWYLNRSRGGWGWFGVALALFHFALPFFMLLSRDLKRDARRLAIVAGVVLLMRFIDLIWIIIPNWHPEHLSLSLLELLLIIAVPLGLGGVWLAYFSMQLSQRPLMPVNDPYLETAFEHEGH